MGPRKARTIINHNLWVCVCWARRWNFSGLHPKIDPTSRNNWRWIFSPFAFCYHFVERRRRRRRDAMKYFKSLVKHNFPLQRLWNIFFVFSTFFVIYGDLAFFVARPAGSSSRFWATMLNSEQRESRLRNYVRATRRYRSQHEMKSFDMFSPFNHPRTWHVMVHMERPGGWCTERDSPSSDASFTIGVSGFLHTRQTRIPCSHTPARVSESGEREGERRARRSHKEWKYVLILCVSKKPKEFSLTVRQKTHKNCFFVLVVPLSSFAFLFSGGSEKSKNTTENKQREDVRKGGMLDKTEKERAKESRERAKGEPFNCPSTGSRRSRWFSDGVLTVSDNSSWRNCRTPPSQRASLLFHIFSWHRLINSRALFFRYMKRCARADWWEEAEDSGFAFPVRLPHQ